MVAEDQFSNDHDQLGKVLSDHYRAGSSLWRKSCLFCQACKCWPTYFSKIAIESLPTILAFLTGGYHHPSLSPSQSGCPFHIIMLNTWMYSNLIGLPLGAPGWVYSPENINETSFNCPLPVHPFNLAHIGYNDVFKYKM